MIPRKEFMEGLYVTCEKCGYNNLKKRNENFGTCLCCGEVLDKRLFFKANMKRLAMRNPKNRARKGCNAILSF